MAARRKKQPNTAPKRQSSSRGRDQEPSWLRQNAVILAERLRRLAWRHKTAANVFWVALIGLPPTFILNFFSIEAFAKEIESVTPKLADLLRAGPFQWVMAASFWVPFVSWLRNKASLLLDAAPNGWSNAPQIVLKTLDQIVGHKEQRFSKHVAEVIRTVDAGGPRPVGADVFETITQPDSQINRLGEGIYTAFQLLLRTDEAPLPRIKVNIALLRGPQVVKILCQFPADRPVRSSPAQLSSRGSGICTAQRTQRIHIVSSTKIASSQRDGGFLDTGSGDPSSDGSLICYPISFFANDDVSFVVSIYYPEKGAFERRFAKQYSEVLFPFAVRLRLEYQLLRLKGLVKNEPDAH